MQAATLKTLQVLRWCLVGMIAVVAVGECLFHLLSIVGFQYAYYNIWLIPPLLLLLAGEQLLQGIKGQTDGYWTVLTAAAGLHILLVMAWHPNHHHDEAVMCVACGTNMLARYVLPWVVLTIIKSYESRRKQAALYGCVALGCIAAVFVLRLFWGTLPSYLGFFSACMREGATYGFLLGGIVMLAAAIAQEIRAIFGRQT